LLYVFRRKVDSWGVTINEPHKEICRPQKSRSVSKGAMASQNRAPIPIKVKQKDDREQIIFFPTAPSVNDLCSRLRKRLGVPNYVPIRVSQGNSQPKGNPQLKPKTVVDISFPNSILITFSLAGVRERFAYHFWDGVIVRQVMGFLARAHFFCHEHDLTLLARQSRVPDDRQIHSLFSSGEPMSLTIQMTRKLIPVKFRYVDRGYDFDEVFEFWLSSDDRFENALMKLGAVLWTPAAFVKITDRNQNVVLPSDDVEGTASLHPDPFHVRVVSNTVFYRLPRNFLYDKSEPITYPGLVTCGMAQNHWCKPMEADDPSHIRLVFHERTLLRPDNLAYLESK
jgi:hypothetical protein